ncbi:hypothetical protein [Nonomuraea sp. NPDC005501]|uniref:hypothetical protein n=1 Tax=Nonomuraea sp. NPDC005501 TaxID=3156884 RepID=UPI00339E00CB
MDPAEGDLLPGDHDDAAVAGDPLHGDRLDRGPGRRTGRLCVSKVPHPVPADRIGTGAQQLPRAGIEEHQGVFLDPDSDPAAVDDLGSQHDTSGQADRAGPVL